MLRRLAAGAAIFVGVMSTVVGTLTLLGIKEAPYVTLDWLLVYNVALGLGSVVVGGLIWARHAASLRLAAGVLASHFTVLLIVTALFATSIAAFESVGAMVFRSVVWLLISLAVWKSRSSGARSEG